ncbi:MAG: hypothetical protein ACK59A_08810 [Cyanobacteriota bacterium]
MSDTISDSPAEDLRSTDGSSSTGRRASRAGGEGHGVRQKRSSRPENLSSRLDLLSRTSFLLFGAALASGLYPFQPWAPLWWLRISQLMVDYAPILILALGLALLGSFYASKAHRTNRHRSLIKRMASVIFVVYAVFVPLQVLSFGWFWFASSNQLRQSIRSAETRMLTLRGRISAAATESELRSILTNGAPQPAVGLSSVPLSRQKADLLGAIDRDRAQLRTNLTQQRQRQLANLSVSTVRGLIAASVMAVGLFGVKRLG